jgi:chromosome segregation ATPase
MSERTPSAHSMTVETPDPETERENLAQKVFLLERWKAEAVVSISKLLGERDEALAERDDLKQQVRDLTNSLEYQRALNQAARTEITSLVAARDELKTSLKAAEASIDALRDSLHAREIRLEAFERERSDVRAEVEGLMKATDFQRDRANRLHRMFVKALDAI